MNGKQIAVASALLSLAFAVAGSRKASADVGPPARGRDRAELVRLLSVVHDAGIMPGSSSFLLAVAKRESGFNRLARNTSRTEAQAAAKAFERAVQRGFFENNPWRDDPERWSFGSGGLFGFLPTTGLSQGGPEGPWAQADPYEIFDVASSVAMALSYIRGLMYQFEETGLGPAMPIAHRNWLAIRRGWAAPSLVKDWREEKQRSKDVRRRFIGDLASALGVSEAEATRFALSPATLGAWISPGRTLALLVASR